jgi:predicted proteasome-type protease
MDMMVVNRAPLSSLPAIAQFFNDAANHQCVRPRAHAEARFKTDHEHAFLMAVKELYENSAYVNERTRTVAYEDAMAHLAVSYPDDIEA